MFEGRASDPRQQSANEDSRDLATVAQRQPALLPFDGIANLWRLNLLGRGTANFCWFDVGAHVRTTTKLLTVALSKTEQNAFGFPGATPYDDKKQRVIRHCFDFEALRLTELKQFILLTEIK